MITSITRTTLELRPGDAFLWFHPFSTGIAQDFYNSVWLVVSISPHPRPYRHLSVIDLVVQSHDGRVWELFKRVDAPWRVLR